jgi:hypothetical protein
VAGVTWTGWQPSHGWGGRLHVDWVATFLWTGWQTSVEYAPTHVTRFVTVTFAILGMLIFISTKNGFTRASYEIRRYHKVDGKSIKKLIHSPEKVQK